MHLLPNALCIYRTPFNSPPQEDDEYAGPGPREHTHHPTDNESQKGLYRKSLTLMKAPGEISPSTINQCDSPLIMLLDRGGDHWPGNGLL